ncbi:FlaD/FlaE family flagellar protein [Haloplanus halobius]|uniref:FlaD/FlaE family flagellar protein n=1 Tax=Haloplanus halobius TaxID=2934938 RepID=UPI00200F097F|nr:FlaD/FlaE family flagellar protein [Haloplanus sp. XH21]
MAIDPRNYDVDELRAVSGSESPGRAVPWPGGFEAAIEPADWPGEFEPAVDAFEAESARPAATVAFEAAVRRALANLDQAAGTVERPYLPTLPASPAAERLVFEWLEFLCLQAGRESVDDAVALYERVDWIGEDAAAELDASLAELEVSRANEDNELDTADHQVSLRYIARLAALIIGE